MMTWVKKKKNFCQMKSRPWLNLIMPMWLITLNGVLLITPSQVDPRGLITSLLSLLRKENFSISFLAVVLSLRIPQDISSNNSWPVLIMSINLVLLTEISNQKICFLINNSIWELPISALLHKLMGLSKMLMDNTLGYARPCLVLPVTWLQKSIWTNHIKELKLICLLLLLSFSLWLLDTHLSLRLPQKINITKLLPWINPKCSGKLIAKLSLQEKISSHQNSKNLLSPWCHLIQIKDQLWIRSWLLTGLMETFHLVEKFKKS